jgi:hypothetical protein
MTETSTPTPDAENLKYDLINKYRDLVARRYDDVIENIDNTGISLSSKVAAEIRDFFLDNVYPESAQRRKLDAAFGELRNFTTNPALIWGLLGSLPVALFQFGAQLPHAIRAGITSLHAYTSAIGFEEAMASAAIENDFKAPLTDEQFFECLRAIPQKNLDAFINEASSLFTVISDTTLLTKTINIMEDVIKRMQSKSNLYTSDQVAAIQLGLDLMEKGFELLEPYSEEVKKDIIAFITENERKFIIEIHSSENRES